MKAQRQHRVASWLAWLGVAGLVGATVGPAMILLLVGLCACGLGAEEVGYRRRARVYFARLHRSTLRRHDAVLDAWMDMREDTASRPSARLVDDVSKKPTAAFVDGAASAVDARAAVRPGDHPSVAAYDEAVVALERSWRRLERRARSADALDDARRWGLDRLPDGATAAFAPLFPVVRAAAQAAWNAAENRFAPRTDEQRV